MQFKDLKKLKSWLWEIPSSFRSDMRVPARIFASEKLLSDIFRDRSLAQLVNTTTLPGIQQHALVMPDAHEGYGFPIGGVVATAYPDGVISPGGIGYDINCGVRLIKSELTAKEIEARLEDLVVALFAEVPSGVGQGGPLKLNNSELNELLKKGAKWIVERGWGDQSDLKNIESQGQLAEADPTTVSQHAKERGRDQVGTLGAGNHFVEIDRVEELYTSDFGLYQDQVVILIHTGSRGLGHQVATDYLRTILQAMPKLGITLPDAELAGAPLSSAEGSAYFAAMSAAANFAWANRQMISWEVKTAWQKVLGKSSGNLSLLYDVAHNIAKIEEYDSKKMIIHRKGATRAFPGQPVIIPGSMGTASYVLVGAEGSLEQSFGSTCHGAGRRMSRHAAQRAVNITELKESLAKAGIHFRTGSNKGLAEEAPQAYKDVAEVVEVVHQAGLAKKVAKLKPLAIIKG